MTRSATALLTLFALLAALLSIMTWASRRTHNAADFAIANRRLGPWLVTLSYAASGVNAWMLMAVAAAAFLWGLSAAWIWAAVVFGCIVNLWFVAPRLRAASIGSGGVTVIHLLSADAGDRFAAARRALGCLHRARDAVDAGRGDPAIRRRDAGGRRARSEQSAGVCARGHHRDRVRGRHARGERDRHDSIRHADRGRLVPAAARADAAGGLSELKLAFATVGPEALDWFDGKSGVAAIAFAAGVVGLGLAMCGQPHALARFIAAKDETTLRIARWAAPVWIAILLAAVVFCGWCARVLYLGLEHPEQSLAVIASRLLPPWLATLIVVALAASVISAIASQLLTIASGLAVDLKRPTAPPSLTLMRGMLLVTAVLACIALLYAPGKIGDHAMFAFTARSVRRSVRCCSCG